MTEQTAAGATALSDAPIYADLVQERGDVLAAVRRTAEQTHRTADRALNFGFPHTKAA
ncbi:MULTISPECIES: hypothetical protein [unclassified Streptomyces]|uniref:hypothetical protein n=1 Tax=unclassified Streptomyces TaxID=2593676 RepID=UPI00225AE3DF|nr:hypothetical protein [Streptomyces sp. NBC_01264]MCX4783903.1 hypothetical protein [Streptomyces sp. NBC_01264]